MTPQDIVKYWQDTAQDDLDAAIALFDAKKYSQCLFFCHLAIEKQLKGLVYVKTDEPPLPIHNLTKLAAYARLKVSKDIAEQLDEISNWNIEARYDSIKRAFYKKATNKFTFMWLRIVQKVYLWLQNQY